MGNWALEIFKMGCYMTFPVTLFWYFNQPESFESWMMSKRKELFHGDSVENRVKLQKCIEIMEKKREADWEKKFQEENKLE